MHRLLAGDARCWESSRIMNEHGCVMVEARTKARQTDPRPHTGGPKNHPTIFLTLSYEAVYNFLFLQFSVLLYCIWQSKINFMFVAVYLLTYLLLFTLFIGLFILVFLSVFSRFFLC